MPARTGQESAPGTIQIKREQYKEIFVALEISLHYVGDRSAPNEIGRSLEHVSKDKEAIIDTLQEKKIENNAKEEKSTGPKDV